MWSENFEGVLDFVHFSMIRPKRANTLVVRKENERKVQKMN